MEVILMVALMGSPVCADSKCWIPRDESAVSVHSHAPVRQVVASLHSRPPTLWSRWFAGRQSTRRLLRWRPIRRR